MERHLSWSLKNKQSAWHIKGHIRGTLSKEESSVLCLGFLSVATVGHLGWKTLGGDGVEVLWRAPEDSAASWPLPT